MKESPFFFLLLLSGILFTILAAIGKNNIYRDQQYHPEKGPLLSILFTAMNEDIYPWQLFTDGQAVETEGSAVNLTEDDQNGQNADQTSEGGQNPDGTSDSAKDTGEGNDTASGSASTAGNSTVSGNAAGNSTVSGNNAAQEKEDDTAGGMPQEEPPYGENRPEPLRGSTEEEYLSHISADIYGDAGVQKAAEYPFVTVDESYFDDALFIGDSRTVGLHDYTDLSEHADFLCKTSLTIYKVLEENFKGMGTVEEVLKKKQYGKIYIMVGINELGRGTTEDFMAKYTEVVDTLHEWDPDARIIIQGIMKVSGKKDAEDKVFNNSNITGRNHAIATLADNYHIFYIDMNEAVCDEEGNLNAEYTHDQIHLLGMYNDLWKDFLMTKGISG